MAQRLYTCGGGCRGKFKRSEVLPPLGAHRPPGMPWRCTSCHAKFLRDQFNASLALRRRALASRERRGPAPGEEPEGEK